MKKLTKVFLIVAIVLVLLASPVLFLAGAMVMTTTSEVSDVVASPDGQYKAVIVRWGDGGGVSIAGINRWISPHDFGNVYRWSGYSEQYLFLEWIDENTLYIHDTERMNTMQKTKKGNIIVKYFTKLPQEEKELYRPNTQQ